MKKYFIFFLFYFISSFCFSDQIILECNIKTELENGKPARKKIYKAETIEIFLNKKEKWINDEPFDDWLGNNELKNRIITSYEDKKKKISFSFKKFHSIEKENIESSFEINFEKEKSFLQFIKYYHDWSGKIFFSSEISGKCKKKNS